MRGSWSRVLSGGVATVTLVAGIGATPAFAAEGSAAQESSDLRIGVLALADAIAAVGQTPELAEPLPFTRTSLAQVLDLDDMVTATLIDELAGGSLQGALAAVPGVENVQVDGENLSFTYARTATVDMLELAEDDGTLRFGDEASAGKLTVTLKTPVDGTPFVVRVDEGQSDPLLKFALVSEPQLALTVDVANDDVAAFDAREGFTDVEVTGGRYNIDREALITLRDPDGRGLLTLEDLRYSTLPDLFRIERTTDDIDVAFALRLPTSIGLRGGEPADRTGTLSVTETSTPADRAWPASADATRSYNTALQRATSLSVVDGITALSKYTGTTLALQDAADVQFPQLTGGTGDLFAPGDELLDLLATAAVAQIRCGLAPGSPPTGTPAPGDTVYCQAVTPAQLGAVTAATWTVNNGNGTLAATSGEQIAAVGASPTGTVMVTGSNGEPDLTVTLTAGLESYTARTLPRTVQQVVQRIGSIGTTVSTATLDLAAKRLDVDVDLRRATATANLPLGNPGTLGALVGLTGLDDDDDATVPVTATGARYDVGFGISTAAPGADEERDVVLLPRDRSLLTVDGLSAANTSSDKALKARIGFLGVTAKVKDVALGRVGDAPAVSLDLRDTVASGPIALDQVIGAEGTLDATRFALVDKVTAGIDFTATESALPGGGYATDGGPATGSASVAWAPGAVPDVGFDTGYDKLRIFDPVPATFLAGVADVTQGTDATTGLDADSVIVTVTGGDLHDRLGVAAPVGGTAEDTEVARRLMGPGIGCQNVTLLSDTQLACEGLAPQGIAAFEDAEAIDLIVLGDPFALRDGIVEGFSSALNMFERLDSDNIEDGLEDDQYTSTLPLVDLTPVQLATERAELRTGLAKLVDAATQDEGGTGGGNLPAVSSVQEMTSALAPGAGGLLTGSTGIDFDVAAGQLGVALGAETKNPTPLKAPLRFFVKGPGQLMGATSVDVPFSSATTLAVDVETATARPAVSEDTETVSKVDGFSLDNAALAGKKFQAGAGDLVLAETGSTASLDIDITTAYDAGALKTTRATTAGGGFAAVADLTVVVPAAAEGEPVPDDGLEYKALATDSSGGGGALQPAPTAMQVKYVAEGLDGLAAALGNALDGAAPRNAGSGGSPVSAPLIGTDLDAGAGVAEKLTALTSELRTTLASAAVTDANTPVEVKSAVKTAVETAIGSAAGVGSTGTVTVSLTCVDEPCDGEADSTEWQELSVEMTLTGDEVTSTMPFDIGLAGLNVRSDKPIDTTTSWTLPVELLLTRGTGPEVRIDGDALELDIAAALPGAGINAVVGYLPAKLTAHAGAGGAAANGAVKVGVQVAPADGTYSLFDLYDGKLGGTPAFLDGGQYGQEDGIDLDFDTIAEGAGTFALAGHIKVPWTADKMFDEDVEYLGATIDMGGVVQSLSKPFAIVDPYLGPVRDVVDVLRTPIPVVSDLSELGGGDEISLLSLLATLGGDDARLTLALRVIDFIAFATDLVGAIAAFSSENGEVALENLAAAGAMLSVDPSEVELASSCSETTKTATTTGTTKRVTKATAPCDAADEDAATTPGAKGQTTNENRTGKRNVSTSVSQTTKGLTGSAPGFSVPFMEDPDQLVDLITGEGEATYFRIDFGSLVASVAYTQSFGPIMAGPVPIKPFVGGSISVEGRLAVGFDSYPQTLAVRGLSHPGDVDGLVEAWGKFKDGDIITEGFYIDDLDADGVDVPEVKMVTTIEAGAGVSIGIVTAGLKGGITLTINLDLADPNRDGKLRTAEIETAFSGNAKCIFDVSATLEAFIAIFIEIDLLLTSMSWEFDILRLGPYTLFEYGCPPEIPDLVVWDGTANNLALTSGSRSAIRNITDKADGSDDYEVRQFDSGGGLVDGGTATYEVNALNYVQRVEVKAVDRPETEVESDYKYEVNIFKTAVALSSEVRSGPHTITDLAQLGFLADGGNSDDTLQFLQGETFDENDELVTTAFSTRVTASGGPGKDTIATGDADDTVSGGDGDDSIDAGLGDDVLSGDAGNDLVNGGAGTDDLAGGEGHDRLQGGPGADRVNGGDGNDSVTGGAGRDVRAVLIADTTTEAAAMAQEQAEVGFDSGDLLVGGDGVDSVDGGDGSDVVVGGIAPLLTAGLVATQMVTGTRDVNVLAGDAEGVVSQTPVKIQTAKVPGFAQLDTLCESGTLASSAGGTDFVTGGPEADVLVGSNASDVLDGGAGPDELCGLNGDDQLIGDGAAAASADKAEDRDILRGGLGDDRIEGGAGDDVAFGDDVDLFRNDARVLGGSLGLPAESGGTGDDYLDGGVDDDILSGGRGSDQIVGGAGHDVTSGEGTDTVADGSDDSTVADRLVDCNVTTRVVSGYLDLNGDLLAGTATVEGADVDNGHLAGLEVAAGVVQTLGIGGAFTGLLAGEFVVIGGRIDLDRDGTVESNGDDTGMVGLASMSATSAENADGDCIVAGEGDDLLLGGNGSDHLAGGDGVDLAEGGDGNDLMLGDGGTDVLRGGAQDDVMVGGLGDDHLVGEAGDDRLRGNEGVDSMVGGSESSEAADGQDVLIGGRQDDVLVAENGTVVSDLVVSGVDDANPAAAWTDRMPATVLAGTSSAMPFADSAVVCGTETASRWVTLLEGGSEARVAVASPGTPVAYDELYGGFGCDWVFGSVADDIVRGGQDDDVVEGGPGADIAHGDAGEDVVVGGSSTTRSADAAITVGRSGAGTPDGGDTVFGDRGPDGEVGDDLIAGDNATPVRRTAGGYDLTLADIPLPGVDVDATTAGDDEIYGSDLAESAGTSEESDADRIFAQAGDDTVHAGADFDYVEGGADDDIVFGDAGEDVVVGGSALGSGTSGPEDGDDVLYGDGGLDESVSDDLLLGDNGTPALDGDGVWMATLASTWTDTSAGDDEIFGGDARGDGRSRRGPDLRAGR